MEFMTVKQAAEKWGLSERRLQTICNEGIVNATPFCLNTATLDCQ